MEKSILIVDDDEMITTSLQALLELTLEYNIIPKNDPEEALCPELIKNNNVNLVISDFLMPKLNGIEFLKKLMEIDSTITTILLTGYADKENAIKSINELDLYYYIEKPWDNNELIKIIQNGMEKRDLLDRLSHKVIELEQSNDEINRLYSLLKSDYSSEVENIKSVIISLANVIEAKDKYTEGHARRVGEYSVAMGKKLGIAGTQLENLEIAGIIHDIGKVGVSEKILNKPGKLTPDEFETMKTHSVAGDKICRPLNCMQKSLHPIRGHHEKLDGSGYPDGLKADEISLETRILTVADIFDAMYSDRPYRKRLPLKKIRSILLEDVENNKLDRKVVTALIELIDNQEIDLE